MVGDQTGDRHGGVEMEDEVTGRAFDHGAGRAAQTVMAAAWAKPVALNGFHSRRFHDWGG